MFLNIEYDAIWVFIERSTSVKYKIRVQCFENVFCGVGYKKVYPALSENVGLVSRKEGLKQNKNFKYL